MRFCIYTVPNILERVNQIFDISQNLNEFSSLCIYNVNNNRRIAQCALAPIDLKQQQNHSKINVSQT